MTKADTLYPVNPDEYKTVQEVAKAVGRSPEMIRQYIQTGVLPAVEQKRPGERGRPRKMVRAGDIFLIAFRPRWDKNRKTITTPSGRKLHPTTLPDD